MKTFNERTLANAGLTGLVALGLVFLALLVLAPDYVQARLDRLQPISMQSGLQANYAADPLGMVVQPIELKAVEQSIADQIRSTTSSRQQAATVMNALNTPVFTITPRGPQTGGSPTLARSLTRTLTQNTSATPTQIVASSTATETSVSSRTSTFTATASGTKPTSTSTSRANTTPRASFTPQPTQGAATLAPTQTRFIATSTWTPKPPNKTATATAKPATNTPAPATRTPLPPTRTRTPVGYPPPVIKTTVPAYP